MAWVEVLRRAREQATQQSAHPWAARLERLRGIVGNDGVERITTQAVFDVLDVPQRARTAAACSTIARLMRDMGWTPIRTRSLARGGFRDHQPGGWQGAKTKPDTPYLTNLRLDAGISQRSLDFIGRDYCPSIRKSGCGSR